MADIFLSYASKDIDRTKRLVRVLERQGWSVWWDRKIQPGKSYDQVIEEEIAKAKCVLVLWSLNSVQSDWVKTEADEGRRRQILAPALIDNVTIPLGFRRLEAANLSDWKGDLSHPELRLLLTSIGEILGQSPQPIKHEEIKSRWSLWFDLWSGKAPFWATITLAIIIALLIVSRPSVREFLWPAPSASPTPSYSPSNPSPSPIQSLSPGVSPSPSITPKLTPSPTASPSPKASPAPTVETGIVLEKVEGDHQVIPAGGWKNFSVRVVDAQGQPVKGAKVAWQTVEGGAYTYVSETKESGMTSATNLFTFSSGNYTQAATLVSTNTPTGFTTADQVTPIGNRVTFTFSFR